MEKSMYYLFTYLCIDQLSCFEKVTRRTDQNMALFKVNPYNSELIAFYELERYTGLKKHDRSFYNVEQCQAFIDEILNEIGLSLNQIDVIWGTKELEKGVNTQLYEKIEHFFTEIPFYPHHCYHLFSCLQMDTSLRDEEMLVFAVDGGPDFVDVMNIKPYQYAGCYRKHGKLSFFSVYSPGPLWALAKNYFHIKEGTLMALASACHTELIGFDESPPLICSSSTLIKAYDFFTRLLDYASNALKKKDETKFTGFDKTFSDEDCLISCVMKEIQKVSYSIMDINVKQAQKMFNINLSNCILGMAGGFALNCPSNSYLLSKYSFRGFIAPPCVNDSGISLGMGLFYLYMQDSNRSFYLQSAYYGYRGTLYDLRVSCEAYSSFIKNITDFDVQRASVDIQKAPLLWLEGAAEIGPRALGHRSIIADPRYIKNKHIINQYKKRPFWQPIAPIILDAFGYMWFEQYISSPFMLLVLKFKANRADEVPAISHLDNTARVQSIKESDNSLLFQVLSTFYKHTGVPLICNTSLNDKGEPIINTLSQAINFALRNNINIVYFDGMRIELHNHSYFQEITYEERKYHKYFNDFDQKIL